jgi:hypothetical protein
MIGATLDLKNPDRYGGESSHATAPIYFIMEGTWKGFPAAGQNVLELLFNVYRNFEQS